MTLVKSKIFNTITWILEFLSKCIFALTPVLNLINLFWDQIHQSVIWKHISIEIRHEESLTSCNKAVNMVSIAQLHGIKHCILKTFCLFQK